MTVPVVAGDDSSDRQVCEEERRFQPRTARRSRASAQLARQIRSAKSLKCSADLLTAALRSLLETQHYGVRTAALPAKFRV
jgi:hypothetical protein